MLPVDSMADVGKRWLVGIQMVKGVTDASDGAAGLNFKARLAGNPPLRESRLSTDWSDVAGCFPAP